MTEKVFQERGKAQIDFKQKDFGVLFQPEELRKRLRRKEEEEEEKKEEEQEEKEED